MKNEELNNYIKRIGSKAYYRLEKLNIPPYPKYYQDSFKDLLMQDEKDKEIENLLKNNRYLFETLENDKEIHMLDSCYTIAKDSIKEFSKTNENLKQISRKSSIDLNKITKDLEELDNSKLINSFNEFHLNLLQTLKEADNTIMKLQEEILVLEKESNIDPLTKLYNKRALLKDLEELLKYGKDKDLDLSLLVLDLDDFKKINDTYGHIAGDKTLIYIGKVLKNNLRNDVKTYRFGGEEFVVVLNRIEAQEAKKIAERVLKTVSVSKLIYKNNTIKITVSAGITSHKAGDSVESFIERADKALYEAKASGKNQVVLI